MKLIITEHYPIISDFLKEEKYVSGYLRSFVRGLAEDGWDWASEHKSLTWSESA